MQHTKQRSIRHKLTDYDKVGQAYTSAYNWQDVSTVENPQSFVFLVECACDSLRGFLYFEHFNNDFGVLPISFPCLQETNRRVYSSLFYNLVSYSPFHHDSSPSFFRLAVRLCWSRFDSKKWHLLVVVRKKSIIKLNYHF